MFICVQELAADQKQYTVLKLPESFLPSLSQASMAHTPLTGCPSRLLTRLVSSTSATRGWQPAVPVSTSWLQQHYRVVAKHSINLATICKQLAQCTANRALKGAGHTCTGNQGTCFCTQLAEHRAFTFLQDSAGIVALCSCSRSCSCRGTWSWETWTTP
jgi:hypothetical protein